MIRLPEVFTVEHARLVAGWSLTAAAVAALNAFARIASSPRGRAVLVALTLIAA
jgi:hypothetical protein